MSHGTVFGRLLSPHPEALPFGEREQYPKIRVVQRQQHTTRVQTLHQSEKDSTRLSLV